MVMAYFNKNETALINCYCFIVVTDVIVLGLQDIHRGS